MYKKITDILKDITNDGMALSEATHVELYKLTVVSRRHAFSDLACPSLDMWRLRAMQLELELHIRGAESIRNL